MGNTTYELARFLNTFFVEWEFSKISQHEISSHLALDHVLSSNKYNVCDLTKISFAENFSGISGGIDEATMRSGKFLSLHRIQIRDCRDAKERMNRKGRSDENENAPTARLGGQTSDKMKMSGKKTI